ncbi:MAG TPA: hypothetical protein DCP92_17500 [Nitrospiraceae bacterium]|jgi:SAM-dependent methyltransferase|nr:hypothetical protein [Nitrospiraceae bacterium]
MAKTLDEYAKEWQGDAEADALWVILTDSRYYGGKWNVEDFFATGDEEIERVFRFMQSRSLRVNDGCFLDFGCGVGRISKALRKRFQRGFGVDISPKTVDLARSYVKGVDFMVNQCDSLPQFPDDSVDFIYSHIVLQHIPNDYQKRYLDEFLRIVRPGGLAVFSNPDRFPQSTGEQAAFCYQGQTGNKTEISLSGRNEEMVNSAQTTPS